MAELMMNTMNEQPEILQDDCDNKTEKFQVILIISIPEKENKETSNTSLVYTKSIELPNSNTSTKSIDDTIKKKNMALIAAISELTKEKMIVNKAIKYLQDVKNANYGCHVTQYVSKWPLVDLILNLPDECGLHCLICKDIFVKPMKLNCHHMFCKLCINMWLEIKKECPVCCESITKIKFCKDFNNFIIKIIEMGPLDVKESYKLLLNFGKKYDPKVIKKKEKRMKMVLLFFRLFC